MYIRCGTCQAATWIETLEPGVAALTIACTECGQEYSLLAAGELGTTSDEQYQRAREYAEYNGIDLPSAYSVMLGFMSLEAAKADRDRRVEASEEAPRFERTAAESLPYDEGFADAVNEGLMTVQQAVDRGNRRELADRIAARHEMPLELALKVADNRLSLAEARMRRPPSVQVAVSRRPATRSHKILLLGFAAMILVIVTVQGWLTFHSSDAPPAPVVVADRKPEPAPEPLDPVAAAIAATRVQRDESGRVLRVSGPDPRSVLIAFCKATLTGRYKPVELTSGVPALPGTRLGVFRDQDRLERLLAIRIQRDRKTRDWVAGNGRDPVPTRAAPDRPHDGARMPVSIE